jgi:hypothetical protein
METGVCPLIRPLRAILYVAAILVLAAATSLFVFSEDTARLFAWTIASPLTAAFLGANYAGAFALEFLAARRRAWSDARVAVPAVTVFTAITLVVTLVHLDKFHFDSSVTSAQVLAWVWLAIYALVPAALVPLLVLQVRRPGGDPPATAPMPQWIRAAFAFLAAVFLVVGTIFLLAPAQSDGLWAWGLTPLTARATGAWLVGLGLAAAHAAWERDLVRARPVHMAAAVLGGLQFLALARYSSEFAWSSVAGWAYLVLLSLVLVVGIGGLRGARKVEARPERSAAGAA